MAKSASGLRVLIVDDNADAAEALSALFTYDGADARVQIDANNIVDVVRDFDPALILLDLELPGLDGCTACRLIRGLKGPDVYIAAVTGWNRDEDRSRSHEAGFDVHLIKPVGPVLLEKLSQSASARLADRGTRSSSSRSSALGGAEKVSGGKVT